MLITRPDGLELIKVEVEFNFQSFEYLEIDLSHVNKDGRSNYIKEDVATIFISIIDGIYLSSTDEKEFEDYLCSYFVRSGSFENKNYKLVFCICSDRSTSIGVITLHRV